MKLQVICKINLTMDLTPFTKKKKGEKTANQPNYKVQAIKLLDDNTEENLQCVDDTVDGMTKASAMK